MNVSYESYSESSNDVFTSASLPSPGEADARELPGDPPSAGEAEAVPLARRWLEAHDATRERAAASPRRRCDARTAETLRA